MRLACFFAVLLCSATAFAENPYLPAAKKLYESVEYDAAMDQLDRARGFAGTTPDELVQIEVFTGLVKFELGDAEAARVAFRTALALDANAELPKGVSPKVRAEWNSIKVALARVKVPDTTPKPAPPTTTPAASPNPPPAPTETKPAPTPTAAATPTPTATPPEAVPAAAPSAVVLTPSDHAPAGDLTTKTPEAEPTKAPFFVMGGAVLLGAAGGYFGMMSKQASTNASSDAVQIQAGADKDTAHSRALVANVLFGAAAVAAVGGVVWYLER